MRVALSTDNQRSEVQNWVLGHQIGIFSSFSAALSVRSTVKTNPMAIGLGVGYLLAFAAAICNGSFLVPFKTPAVHSLKVDPLVFQLYAAVGIFVASWLLALFLPLNESFVDGSSTQFVFEPLALLSGCLIMLSMAFSFFATRKIGVALAQGIFGGLAIIVSYIWGSLLFNESAKYPGLSAFGIVLIVAGIAAIGACKEISLVIARRFPDMSKRLLSLGSNQDQRNPISVEVIDDAEEWGLDAKAPAEDAQSEEDHRQRLVSERASKDHPHDYIRGVIYAMLCGGIGGSSLVPLYYIDEAHRGLAIFPALGVGALLTAPTALCCYFKFDFSSLPPMGFDVGFYAGILGGVIWTGNCVLTIGCLPVLGYSVAFPLVHCSVFISGLWGIYMFHEFDGFPFSSIVFFLSGAVLIAGAILVSISK